MNPQTLTIARLKEKSDDPAYLADLRACAVESDTVTMTFDLDAPCLKATREKWRTPKSRGLGDTIAKIASAVGIKPCGGCKKRQAKWNKRFPYQ